MHRLFATLLFLAFTLSCSESPPMQQATPTESAMEEPVVAIPAGEKSDRLEVGDQVPNFQLQDQTGTVRTLDGLLKKGKIAVVFHRSADW